MRKQYLIAVMLTTSPAYAGDVVHAEPEKQAGLKTKLEGEVDTRLETRDETRVETKAEAKVAEPVKSAMPLESTQSSEMAEPTQTLDEMVITATPIELEKVEVSGRYIFDREIIEALPKSNGDFTEFLDSLPGVSLGSEAYDADSQAEIKAQKVSINNAEAWQTGFFLDGVNINSRLDPDAKSTTENDIEGGAQTFNVSTNIIESIEVFDNNIPAEYGGFSGGVVKVKTRELGDDRAKYGLSYRTSRSDWNKYRVYVTPARNGVDSLRVPDEPNFEKQAFSAYYQDWLNDELSVLLSLSRTQSEISDISFQSLKTQARASTNVLLKASHYGLGIDLAQLSFVYAPYTSDKFTKDVRASDYRVNGGGATSKLNLEHYYQGIEHSLALAYTHSDNSRDAPLHRYDWRQLNGKDWGLLDSDESSDPQLSREGGFGKLDKTQQTASLNYKAVVDSFDWGEAEHSITTGLQMDYERIERRRDRTSYHYQSAIHDIPDLNCSGFSNDCVERVPGVMAPQYFSLRRVYAKEYIDVDLYNLGLHLSDQIEWRDLSLNLGLRYDSDSFLNNHNIAPRISLGYRPFGHEDTLLISGFNRYYDNNMLTYKVREQKTPVRYERRSINGQKFVQSWQPVSGEASSRYRFKDVKTPYNDEWVVGIKDRNITGVYSLKYIRRWQRDQLLTESSDFNPADGYYYKNQVNVDNGENERISFTWSKQWSQHAFWASISHQISSTYKFEESLAEAAVDNLIIIRENGSYRESTTANLDQYASAFGQPLDLKFGVNTQWSEHFSTSFKGIYRDSFDTYVDTNTRRDTEQIDRVCPDCNEFDYIQVPVFEKRNIHSRLLLDAGFDWKIPVFGQDKVTLRLDVQNLFNSRTYTAQQTGTGVEIGRSYWLSLSYDH